MFKSTFVAGFRLFTAFSSISALTLKDQPTCSSMGAAQRHLLSAGDVSHPIASPLVVDINAGLSVVLDKVFEPGFDLLSTGPLPSWASLEYKQLASLPTGGEAYTTVIQGDKAFVAAETTWQIYNTSSFAMLANISVLNGSVYSLAVSSDGAYTFVATYTAAGTLIYDTSTLIPVLRSTYPAVMDETRAMLLSPDASTLYVASLSAGVDIVDVTNKSSPSKITTLLAGTAYAVGLGLYNNLLAIAMADNGTSIWDISNRSNPSPVASIPGLASAATFSQTGDKLVVGCYFNGSKVFDMSTPSAPILRNLYPSGLGGSVVATQLIGNTLLVADGLLGIQIIDASIPTGPVSLGTYPVGLGGSYGIVLDGNGNLWISNGPAGVMVLDPRRATLRGFPPTLPGGQYPITVSSRSFSGPLSSDNFSLILDYPPHLSSVATWPDQRINPGDSFSQDLSANLFFTQTQPSLLQLSLQQAYGEPAPAFFSLQLALPSVSTYPVSAIKIRLCGQNLFVPGGGNITISNTGTLRLQGTILSSAREVLLSPSCALAFIIEYSAVSVFNVSNASAPLLISTIATRSTGQNYGAALSAESLFVSNNVLGLQRFNVSKPSNLTLTGIYPVPSYFVVIAADGRVFAVVSAGIQVLNPSLQPLATINSTNYITQLSISGNSVYALSYYVLNIYDLNTLQFLGSYPVVERSSCLATYGHMLIMCDGNVAQFLDVTHPTQVTSLGIFPAPGSNHFNDVAISGTKAFFAAGSSVLVTDLSLWRLTATPNAGDEGNYGMKLIPRTANGGTMSTTATWRVEGAPRVNGIFPLQELWVGQPTLIQIPAGLVTDPNFDPIEFSLLPNPYPWFKFNSYAATFYFTAPSTALGNMNVSVSVTDHISGTVNVTVTARVSYLPVVNQRIPAKAAGIDLPYQLNIPSHTFYNFNQGDLVLSIQGIGAQSLPAWISFNGTSINGMPTLTDAGTQTIIVTATNQYAGQISTDLSILVEHFPRLTQVIPAALAGIDEAFALTIPLDTFTSSSALAYSAQQVHLDGQVSSLPSWLTFDAVSRGFSGVPPAAMNTTLRITATDSNGGSAYTDFSLTARQFPRVVTPISTAPELTAGLPFSYQLPSDTFNQANLKYTLALAGGGDLPLWLNFNATSRTFSGKPPATISNLALQVVGSDDQGGGATAFFTLVIQANLAPQVDIPLINQKASVGEAFQLSTYNAFKDPNPGDTTRLTASYTASWLHFDGSIFSGTPGQTDCLPIIFVTAEPIDVLLQGTDSQGQTASQRFSIQVTNNSTLAWFLKTILPLLGSLGLTLINKRANIRNRRFKDRYGEPVIFYFNEYGKSPDLTDNLQDKIVVKRQRNPKKSSCSYLKFWHSLHEPLDGNGTKFPSGLKRVGKYIRGTLDQSEQTYLLTKPNEKANFENMDGRLVATVKSGEKGVVGWWRKGFILKQHPVYLIGPEDIEAGLAQSASSSVSRSGKEVEMVQYPGSTRGSGYFHVDRTL